MKAVARHRSMARHWSMARDRLAGVLI